MNAGALGVAGARIRIALADSRLALAAILLAGCVGAAAAQADDQADRAELAQARSTQPDKPRPRIEEIVVSAQKREQTLIDVPMSISALSGQTIEDMGIDDLADIARAIPGFTVVDQGPGANQFQMRGISSYTGKATVGYYLDEVVLSTFNQFQADVNTFDLQRIEVLRGPQGTLYGEGSMGGTLKLITNPPDPTAWDARARGSWYQTRGGDLSVNADMALNIPLARDLAALRVVGSRADTGGWIDQVDYGQFNDNGSQKKSLRAKLLVTPHDRLDLSLMSIRHKLAAGAPNLSDENYDGGAELDTFSDDDSTIYNLTGTWSADFADIFFTTAKFDRLFSQRGDLQRGLEEVSGADTFGPSKFVYLGDADVKVHELRLNSVSTGRWVWTAGAYARDYFEQLNLELNYAANTMGVAPVISSPFGSLGGSNRAANYEYTNISQSWAVFGQVEYDITDWLTALVGTREFREELRFIFEGGTGPVPSSSDDSVKFKTFNPRFNLAARLPEGWRWRFDDASVYINIAKGFRSGGANIPVLPGGLDGVPPFYFPENLWTYEIGAKVSGFGNQLSTELALFFNDWTDLQTIVNPQEGSPVNAYANVGDAEGFGFDLQVTARPWAGLLLSLGAGYVDAGFVTNGQDKLKGDPIDFVPKWTLSSSIGYSGTTFGLPLMARVDASYQSKSRLLLRSSGVDDSSDETALVNARFGIEREAWQIYLFGSNLGSERRRMTPLAILPRPRTLGLEIKWSMD